MRPPSGPRTTTRVLTSRASSAWTIRTTNGTPRKSRSALGEPILAERPALLRLELADAQPLLLQVADGDEEEVRRREEEEHAREGERERGVEEVDLSHEREQR